MRLDLIRLFLMLITTGLNGCIMGSLFILMHRPALLCRDSEGNYQECTEEEACQSEYPYLLKPIFEHLYSIIMEFDLFCDRKIIETTLISCLTFGQLVGFVASIFIQIPKSIKNTFFSEILILLGLNLLCIRFIHLTAILGPSIFLWNFLYSLYFSNMYTYLSDEFPFLGAKGPAFINTAFPVVQIFYIIFTVYFAHWRNTIDFCGAIYFLGGIGLYVLKRLSLTDALVEMKVSLNKNNQFDIEESKEKQEKQENEHYQNALKVLVLTLRKLIFEKNHQRNFFLFLVCWTCMRSSSFGVSIEVSRFRGNIYVNMMVATLSEFIGCTIGGILVQKFALKNLLVSGYIFMAGGYLVASIYKLISAEFNVFFILTPVLLLKIVQEAMWISLLSLLPTILPQTFVQITFILMCMFSIGFMNILPYYIYFMNLVGVSPMFGYLTALLICSQFFRRFNFSQESIEHKSNILEEHHEQYFKRGFDPKKFEIKFCPRALLRKHQFLGTECGKMSFYSDEHQSFEEKLQRLYKSLAK